jgi:DNA ligase-1
VTNCRAGFTNADLKKLPKMVNKRIISKKNPRVNSILEADVWFKPFIVLEVLGVEVTLSPIHTYAMGSIRKKSGLTIRFPRFPGNYRVDKAAEDATSPRGIVEMCTRQLKKVA